MFFLIRESYKTFATNFVCLEKKIIEGIDICQFVLVYF